MPSCASTALPSVSNLTTWSPFASKLVTVAVYPAAATAAEEVVAEERVVEEVVVEEKVAEAMAEAVADPAIRPLISSAISAVTSTGRVDLCCCIARSREAGTVGVDAVPCRARDDETIHHFYQW